MRSRIPAPWSWFLSCSSCSSSGSSRNQTVSVPVIRSITTPTPTPSHRGARRILRPPPPYIYSPVPKHLSSQQTKVLQHSSMLGKQVASVVSPPSRSYVLLRPRCAHACNYALTHATRVSLSFLRVAPASIHTHTHTRIHTHTHAYTHTHSHTHTHTYFCKGSNAAMKVE